MNTAESIADQYRQKAEEVERIADELPIGCKVRLPRRSVIGSLYGSEHAERLAMKQAEVIGYRDDGSNGLLVVVDAPQWPFKGGLTFSAAMLRGRADILARRPRAKA